MSKITSFKQLETFIDKKFEGEVSIEKLKRGQYKITDSDNEFQISYKKISELAEDLDSSDTLEEFIESAEDAKASEEEVEQEKEEEDDIEDQFVSIEEYIDILHSEAENEELSTNSLIVAGRGGIGKSREVYDYLDNIKADYVVQKGYLSPPALVELLQNHQNSTIVFDDCDSIFFNERSLNILKAATDDDQRQVQWSVNRKDINFDFKGRIIFISNLDFHKISKKAGIGKHIAAILTRPYFVQITNDIDQIMKRIRRVAEIIQPEKAIRDGVLDYIEKNKKKAVVNLRLFKKLNHIMEVKPHRFEILAKNQIAAEKIANN